MKTKTSENPTPRNLESGFSDDGAGTDPMLVFNMSIFSSLLQRENVWS